MYGDCLVAHLSSGARLLSLQFPGLSRVNEQLAQHSSRPRRQYSSQCRILNTHCTFLWFVVRQCAVGVNGISNITRSGSSHLCVALAHRVFHIIFISFCLTSCSSIIHSTPVLHLTPLVLDLVDISVWSHASFIRSMVFPVVSELHWLSHSSIMFDISVISSQD